MTVHKLIHPELIGLTHSSNIVALNKAITFIGSKDKFSVRASLCNELATQLQRMIDHLKPHI